MEKQYGDETEQIAVQLANHSLALLETGPETPILDLASSSISQMYMLASVYDRAFEWGERALTLGKRLGDEEVIIHALNNLGAVYAHLGDIEKGRELIGEALQRALKSGNQFSAGRAFMSLADILMGLCQYSAAYQTFDQLAEFSTRWQLPLYANIALIHLAFLDWITGQWNQAFNHLAQARQWMGEITLYGPVRVWFSIMQGWIDTDLGRPQAAIAELETTLDAARRADELQTTVPHLGALARAYQIAGLGSQAAHIMAELMDWFAGLDTNAFIYDVFPTLRFVGHWQAQNGDDENLKTCVEYLRCAHETSSTPETAANLYEGQALLAWANDNHEQAFAEWRRAAEGWEQLGLPYQQARVLSDLGQALLQSGDVEGAAPAFGRAMGLVESLAKQLVDPALRASFLDSPLVQEIRNGLLQARMRTD